MEKNKQYWINHLKLEPHPEGGYFKQVLRSDQSIQTAPAIARPYYTSIYFLLTYGNPSHFHRLKSDEVWYYHSGASLTIHLLHPDGRYEKIHLGKQIEQGQVLQAVVPKNVIFGSTVDELDQFSLVSCMVSPGFDFADFELFTKKELVSHYPDHQEIITKLAYDHLPK